MFYLRTYLLTKINSRKTSQVNENQVALAAAVVVATTCSCQYTYDIKRKTLQCNEQL